MSVFTRIFCGCSIGVFALLIAFACSSAWAGADPASEADASESGGHGDAGHSNAGHGDAHHDTSDLGHGNATDALEKPEEWRYELALCTFAVFVLLMTLLTVFAWKPIMAALEKREQGIAARIEDAERGAQEAAEKLKQYEAKLAAAADEAAGIVAKGRRDAEAVADRVRDEAHQDAVKERERADADIGAAKNAALRQLTEQGADLAVLLAGRIVRREISADEHATLISDALKQFPSNN